MVDVFVEMVEINTVFPGWEMPISSKRSTVGMVMIFGEETAILTAGIAFVVARLTLLSGDRVALTLSDGLMGSVTSQTSACLALVTPGVDMAFEAFASQEVINQIGRVGDRLFGQWQALERDVGIVDPPDTAGDVDGLCQCVVWAVLTFFDCFGMATDTLLPGR